MINQEILDYIKKEIELGKKQDEIKNILFGVGWKEVDVDEAFESLKPKSQDDQRAKEASTEKEKKINSLFFDILIFVIGFVVAGVVFFLFFNKPSVPVTSQSNEIGFQEQKTNDGKRIGDLLKVQESLEAYYKENKSYPTSLDLLKDVPSNPSGSKYSYTPIGTPPQSYTLNAQMENVKDGQIKIEGGFLTLKNQQGKK